MDRNAERLKREIKEELKEELKGILRNNAQALDEIIRSWALNPVEPFNIYDSKFSVREVMEECDVVDYKVGERYAAAVLQRIFPSRVSSAGGGVLFGSSGLYLIDRKIRISKKVYEYTHGDNFYVDPSAQKTRESVEKNMKDRVLRIPIFVFVESGNAVTLSYQHFDFKYEKTFRAKESAGMTILEDTH